MIKTTRQERSRAKTLNKKRSGVLQEIPRSEWSCSEDETRIKVWISRNFLVQEFKEENAIRLTVNRTTIQSTGRWIDNIEWDDLQLIKREIGYGDYYAIEIYPRECDLVNVANMRHLWILPEPLSIGWFK